MAETFGKTDKGDTKYWQSVNCLCACKFTSGSSGTLASMSIYIKFDMGDTHVKLAIYDSDLNLLENGTTEEKLITVGQDGWVTFNFATPPSVNASTVYWLCFWMDYYLYFYGDPGEDDQFSSKVVTYDSWPSPFPTSFSDYEYSIYATYEEAPPPAKKTLVQTALISIAPLVVLPTLAEILKFTGGC